MALFSIHCTTCRARLKVRDTAAIGQILACPKCGSMVQVLPPEGWQPGDEDAESSASQSSAAQSSAGQSSFGQSRSGLPSSSPSSSSPSSSSPSSSSPSSSQRLDAVRPGAGSTISGRWKDEVPAGGRTQDAAETLGDQVAAQAPAVGTSPVWLKWSLWAGLPTMAACAALVAWHWSSRLPQPQPEPIAAAEKVEAPPNVPSPAKPKAPAEPEATEGAPLPLDRRFIPSGAQALLSLRLADLVERPAAEAVFRHLGTIWQQQIQPLYARFELSPEKIRRLTWTTTNAVEAPGEHWLQAGVVVIELEPSSKKSRPAFAQGEPLDWKLGEAAVYPPSEGGWPHPFALIGNSTIVTGPESLLRELADRSDDGFADAEFQKLLDGLDFGHQAIAAVALRPLRKADALPEWLPLVDVWKVAKDDWRVVRESPGALALELKLGEALDVELRLACESETTAEQVRESLDRLLASMETTLAGESDGLTKKLLAGQITTADASRLKQLLAAGRQALARRSSGVQNSLVWARTPWQGDLPNLAVTTLASVPHLESSRLAAVRPIDEENHQRLLLGLAGYDKAEGALPFGAADASLLPPETRLSWIATLLPYYDRLDWHGELNFSRSWNDPTNSRVTRRPLESVINPALGLSLAKGDFPVTHYVGLAGIGAGAGSLEADDPRAGAFGFRRRLSPSQFTDGASNTIALMGVQGRLGAWGAGGDATVRPLTKKPYINGPDGFGSGQPDGMVVGMADGSVRFLSKDVDPSVLEALATIRGGETPAAVAPSQLADSKPKLEMPLGSPDKPEPAAMKPRLADGPEVDVTARLADPLPGIQFKNTPLDEALALLSQMSTVPITLDPEALVEAGVAADAKVSLDLSDTTVGAALSALVAQHRLGYAVIDGQVLVTNPERREQKLETFLVNVADLVSGDQSAEDLAAQLERFVEPTSWQTAGGYGKIEVSGTKLSIEQTRATTAHVSEFLDKLRFARGKSAASKGAKAPSLETRHAAAKSLLAAPVTANFRKGAPLSEIAEHLGQAAKVQLLFDGLALSAAGASPATEAELTVADAPLSEALQTLLTPLQLTYRIADAGQLVITTPEALGERLEVEFYPVEKLLGKDETAETLIERIKSELDPRSWDDAGGPGLIEYDPSGYLIVLQTQPRQIELEELLDAWRAAAKANQ